MKEDAGIEVTGTGGVGNEAFQQAAQSLTSQLRSRKAGDSKAGATTATGTSLFSSKPQATTETTTTAKTEALLSHNRNEQEALTESLLTMAQQLKAQSLQFGSTLEADKSVLERALAGLEKNTEGMDAASQRMGTLRRMTEGKGWWARIKLYALIFGLWVVAFLIFFVGPKIRF